MPQYNSRIPMRRRARQARRLRPTRARVRVMHPEALPASIIAARRTTRRSGYRHMEEAKIKDVQHGEMADDVREIKAKPLSRRPITKKTKSQLMTDKELRDETRTWRGKGSKFQLREISEKKAQRFGVDAKLKQDTPEQHTDAAEYHERRAKDVVKNSIEQKHHKYLANYHRKRKLKEETMTEDELDDIANSIMDELAQESAPVSEGFLNQLAQKRYKNYAKVYGPGIVAARKKHQDELKKKSANKPIKKKTKPIKEAVELPPLHQIAREIRRNWKKPYFGAVPYLDAMGSLETTHEKYGEDSGKSIVAYGLSNMRSYSGKATHDPVLAKQHRAHLKAHLASKLTEGALGQRYQSQRAHMSTPYGRENFDRARAVARMPREKPIKWHPGGYDRGSAARQTAMARTSVLRDRTVSNNKVLKGIVNHFAKSRAANAAAQKDSDKIGLFDRHEVTRYYSSSSFEPALKKKTPKITEGFYMNAKRDAALRNDTIHNAKATTTGKLKIFRKATSKDGTVGDRIKRRLGLGITAKLNKNPNVRTPDTNRLSRINKAQSDVSNVTVVQRAAKINQLQRDIKNPENKARKAALKQRLMYHKNAQKSDQREIARRVDPGVIPGSVRNPKSVKLTETKKPKDCSCLSQYPSYVCPACIAARDPNFGQKMIDPLSDRGFKNRQRYHDLVKSLNLTETTKEQFLKEREPELEQKTKKGHKHAAQWHRVQIQFKSANPTGSKDYDVKQRKYHEARRDHHAQEYHKMGEQAPRKNQELTDDIISQFSSLSARARRRKLKLQSVKKTVDEGVIDAYKNLKTRVKDRYKTYVGNRIKDDEVKAMFTQAKIAKQQLKADRHSENLARIQARKQLRQERLKNLGETVDEHHRTHQVTYSVNGDSEHLRYRCKAKDNNDAVEQTKSAVNKVSPGNSSLKIKVHKVDLISDLMNEGKLVKNVHDNDALLTAHLDHYDTPKGNQEVKDLITLAQNRKLSTLKDFKRHTTAYAKSLVAKMPNNVTQHQFNTNLTHIATHIGYMTLGKHPEIPLSEGEIVPDSRYNGELLKAHFVHYSTPEGKKEVQELASLGKEKHLISLPQFRKHTFNYAKSLVDKMPSDVTNSQFNRDHEEIAHHIGYLVHGKMWGRKPIELRVKKLKEGVLGAILPPDENNSRALTGGKIETREDTRVRRILAKLKKRLVHSPLGRAEIAQIKLDRLKRVMAKYDNKIENKGITSGI